MLMEGHLISCLEADNSQFHPLSLCPWWTHSAGINSSSLAALLSECYLKSEVGSSVAGRCSLELGGEQSCPSSLHM